MAKILSRIVIGFGSLSLVGGIACSAAPPDESERTGSVESAVCYVGCTYCKCILGTLNMTTDPCGKALLAAHCYGDNGPGSTTAEAYGTGSSSSDWRFWANCPSNIVIPTVCKNSPYYAQNLSNYFCCIGNAGTGRTFIGFDPNCPGCSIYN